MKLKALLKKNAFEIALVLLFITLYTLAASLVSLNRHWQYNSFWYDFGIFDTTVWKLSRFKLPVVAQLNPPSGKIVWADHLNPSVIFLAPFYWLSAKAEIIYIAQSLMVALSALVAYIISLKFVKSSLVRISLVVSYLGFVGLQNALYTDVHNIVFALLPLMLSIWAVFWKKWKLYWLFILLTLGIQESLSVLVIMFGAYLLIRKDRQVKAGILTILVGIVYGIVATKIIIPSLNNGSYNYLPAFPQVWHQWFTFLIYPPSMKLKTIILTFVSFGFMPLGAISTFPLIVAHYLERFVLNTAATRWDLGFHYNATLSPIMFLASLESILILQKIKKFSKLLSFWGLFTILLVIFLHRFYLHGPLMLATHPVFYRQTENARFLDNFIRQIPTQGLIMTQNNIAAQFTHFEVMLLNKNYLTINPDTIALDIRSGQNANDFYPFSEEEAKTLAATLSADIKYTKTAVNDTQLIFTRKKTNL